MVPGTSNLPEQVIIVPIVVVRVSPTNHRELSFREVKRVSSLKSKRLLQRHLCNINDDSHLIAELLSRYGVHKVKFVEQTLLGLRNHKTKRDLCLLL